MIKKTAGSLRTLAQIKDREEQEAARRLSAARDRLDRERRNLTTVQQYLAEYAESTDIESTQTRLLVERHRFRLQLERTVAAQQAAVSQAEGQAELARSHWASVRSEREAMTKLVDRRLDAELRRELAADQKQSDEQAMNAMTRQRTDTSTRR